MIETVEANASFIPISNGHVAIVDTEDYEGLNKWKWTADKNQRSYGAIYYASRNLYLGKENGKHKRKYVQMHRIITNAPKGMQVDHIDGDTLDNRKSNLRLVTLRQNRQNLHIKTSSDYPGVSWNKQKQKWTSRIRIGSKRKHLGFFKTEIEAFESYKKACHELIGENVVCEVE